MGEIPFWRGGKYKLIFREDTTELNYLGNYNVGGV
jgi:hypothetical protein